MDIWSHMSIEEDDTYKIEHTNDISIMPKVQAAYQFEHTSLK